MLLMESPSGPMLVIVGALLALVIVLVLTGLKIVPQASAIVVERLGRFHRVGSSGINIVWPMIEHRRLIRLDGVASKFVDLRERVMDFEPQSVITKDNTTVGIDTVVFYQITDPSKAVYEIEDVTLGIRQLATTTLRNVIGEMTLDETLTSREQVNKRLRIVLDDATDKWGVKVCRVELKQIKPPEDVEDAMEKQMKAERDRRAIVTVAEGEREAAVLRAQGERDAAIATAEGQKQAAILEAEGRAESIRRVQEAEADAVRVLDGALSGESPEKVIALRYLDSLVKVADGRATKIVLPYEVVGVLGAVAGMKDVLAGGSSQNGASRLRTQPHS